MAQQAAQQATQQAAQQATQQPAPPPPNRVAQRGSRRGFPDRAPLAQQREVVIHRLSARQDDGEGEGDVGS
jgi:hypothetical protein